MGSCFKRPYVEVPLRPRPVIDTKYVKPVESIKPIIQPVYRGIHQMDCVVYDLIHCDKTYDRMMEKLTEHLSFDDKKRFSAFRRMVATYMDFQTDTVSFPTPDDAQSLILVLTSSAHRLDLHAGEHGVFLRGLIRKYGEGRVRIVIRPDLGQFAELADDQAMEHRIQNANKEHALFISERKLAGFYTLPFYAI